MTTTLQQIIDQATKGSGLNAPLTGDREEMLRRIRIDQKALFTATADITRSRYSTTASRTSASASSGRILDLASPALTLPVERVLRVSLATGEDLNQVDELDTDAELAPRYFQRGTQLIEVGNDWSSTAGAVTATLLYVYGPTDIDPAGATSQNVTVLDEWTELLVLPLRLYLIKKDPGRDWREHDELEKDLDALFKQYLTFLGNYGGVEARRFWLPTPQDSQKR